MCVGWGKEVHSLLSLKAEWEMTTWQQENALKGFLVKRDGQNTLAVWNKRKDYTTTLTKLCWLFYYQHEGQSLLELLLVLVEVVEEEKPILFILGLDE